MYASELHEQNIFNTLQERITQPSGKILTLGQLLWYAATHYPDNIALISGSRQITYKQLFFWATLFAKKLQEKHVKPNDIVLLFFENSIEFYIGYYAIVQRGAIVAPLNVYLKEREFNHIVADAHAKVAVVSRSLLKKLQEQDHFTFSIDVLTQDEMAMPDQIDEEVLQPIHAYQEPEQMAAVLYTSGTTGLPKGVMLSSKNILTNCMQTIARLGIVQGERILGILPFFHSFAEFAYVWAPFLLGCTVIIVPKIERRALLEGLAHKPTFFVGVPALFGLLCLMKNAPIDSVKYFATGGDAMSDKIRCCFELIYGRKLICGYGLSETSPVLTADLQDIAEPTDNVGKPLYKVTISLRNEEWQEVTGGELGEVWVKGDNVMLGYYNAPDKTAEVFKDGWFATGDVGYFNQHGKLVITGRIKDVIAHKGFKIYPQEIENVIMQHSNVVLVGVIGEFDERYGQIPVAYVQIKKEDSTIARELEKLCERNLASYKIPRKFICSTKPLVTTTTGKVDKKILRT